jgi:uncharacterized protein
VVGTSPEGSGAPLAMFPLSTVLFPYGQLPLHIFEPRYRVLMDDCLAGDRQFGVVLIARGREVGGGDRRFAVGTVGHIAAASRFADGRWALLVEGRRRVAVTQWLEEAPYPRALVEESPDGPGAEDDEQFERARRAVLRVRTLLSELGRPAPVVELGEGDDGEGRLWRLCARAPLTPLDGQRLLEAYDGATRATMLVELAEARAADLMGLLGG